MSKLSAQCDELRERAKTLRQGRWSDGADDARLMEDAADTIEGLESDNAKLRELVETVIDDWMSRVCPTFPFCEYRGEYQDCTDETCGNQIYRQMARELGIEVDG